MRAGILSERIDVYRQVETTNEYGELSTKYEKTASYRANVEHKLGDRNIENHEIVYDYSKTFIVRIYADVRDKDRIGYGGKMYQVLGIEPNRQLQQLTILAALINE